MEREKKKKSKEKEISIITRKNKRTGKYYEKEVEGGGSRSINIDLSYDFWEYANRCVANPFMIRFEYSEILYNNLVNND